MFHFSPHIAINVKQYNKACEFYKNVLGFEVQQIKEQETHFKKDTIHFYIETGEISGRVFFEFKVDSISEALKLLLDAGCEVSHTYSEKNMMIKDPYGMHFHIWEEGAVF